jgi:hypothetical protein
VPNLYPQERNFLVSLAQRTRDGERGRTNSKEQIVLNIKMELNGFPPVNINELDDKYHNYESLTLNELQGIKDELITAIHQQQARAKLIILLKETEDCSDHDL